MLKSLLFEPYVALFIIAILGSLLGKVRVFAISLGSSAIILVSLFFGHLGISLPGAIEKIGLILFIFSVGIQAGPGFFNSFKTGEVKQYLPPVFLSLLLIASLSYLVCHFLGLSPLTAPGIFTGVTTSTASLAAVVEVSKSTEPIVPYTIAYPVSMIATVIFIRVLPKILKLDPELEENQYREEVEQHFPRIHAKHFRLENPSLIDKNLHDIDIESLTGAKVTRVKKLDEEEGIIPDGDYQFSAGDHLKAVGSLNSLEKMKLFIGEEIEEEIPLANQITAEWILVTQNKVIGKRLHELNLDGIWQAYISRIRRAGIDIVPNAFTRLRYGDKALVSVNSSTLPNVVRMLGGVESSQIDFLSISLSILMGILCSQIVIPIGDKIELSPGLAGGILIMTLVLGWLGKTGPMLWSIAGSTNQFLRQLGILFFLSGVGTRTGKYLMEAFSVDGLKIVGLSLFISVFTLSLTSLITLKVFKLNKFKLLGALAGSVTCAPALAGINEEYSSSIPGTAYSITFPFALLMTILLAQVLTIISML